MPTIINGVPVPIQQNTDGSYTVAIAKVVNLIELQNEIDSTQSNLSSQQNSIGSNQSILNIINQDIGNGSVLLPKP